MTQLTIREHYRQSEEIGVTCTGCGEDYLISTVNREPDFCMYCGAPLEAATYTNPEKLEH